MSENNADCIHISYHEEAGGWLVCDDCGEDVTLEIERTPRLLRSAFDVPDPIGDEQAEDQDRFFDHNDVTEEKDDER